MIKREYGGPEHNLTLSHIDDKWIVTFTQEIGSWEFNGVELQEHYNVDTMILDSELDAGKVFDGLVIDFNLKEIL